MTDDIDTDTEEAVTFDDLLMGAHCNATDMSGEIALPTYLDDGFRLMPNGTIAKLPAPDDLALGMHTSVVFDFDAEYPTPESVLNDDFGNIHVTEIFHLGVGIPARGRGGKGTVIVPPTPIASFEYDIPVIDFASCSASTEELDDQLSTLAKRARKVADVLARRKADISAATGDIMAAATLAASMDRANNDVIEAEGNFGKRLRKVNSALNAALGALAEGYGGETAPLADVLTRFEDDPQRHRFLLNIVGAALRNLYRADSPAQALTNSDIELVEEQAEDQTDDESEVNYGDVTYTRVETPANTYYTVGEGDHGSEPVAAG